MSYLSPDFKIKILPFNSASGEEYDFPQELIASITSTRSLQGNSISITIPNAMRNIIGLKKFKEILTDQCIIRLYVRKNPSESFRQINVGYMNGLSVNCDAMGRVGWSITFPGLETKLQKQELFLDVATEKQEDESSSRSKTASTFEASFSSIGQALGNVKGLKNLLIGIWDNIIVELTAKYGIEAEKAFQYGGFELVKKWSGNSQNSSALITPYFADGYTENFISKFDLFSQVAIGSSPKYYDAITSMATQPLYECFLDTLDTNGTDDKKYGTILDPTSMYEVDTSPASLVFRKTPFDRIFENGQWSSLTGFKEIKDMSNINFSENPDDIFSGLHIGLTEFDSQDSVLIFPVKWSSVLKKRYGYKVMQIKLDGLTFGMEETRTLSNKNDIVSAMKQIQDKLFTIFVPSDISPTSQVHLKNVTASIDCAFDYFRIGTGLDMGKHELIDFYGRYGYLTSVTDSFAPQGQAKSSLSLKWVDNMEALQPVFKR